MANPAGSTIPGASNPKKVTIKKIKKTSFVDKIVQEFIIKPDIWTALLYLNGAFAYVGAFLVLSGNNLNIFYLLVYFFAVFVIISSRATAREKERLKIAHRIPFFADALANALSVGSTLDQAFVQASWYLKGEMKTEFEKMILKKSLGKDLGELLREIDERNPDTGLRYLISLLEQYRELGVGISPLLKRIAVALTVKQEAEERVMATLSAGSSYARLAIFVFLFIFGGMYFLMNDQMHMLMSPGLRPTFFFLIAWCVLGMFALNLITGMNFAIKYALRPSIEHYLVENQMTTEELMEYSGVDWTPLRRLLLLGSPIAGGFFLAYLVSWYSGSGLAIGFGFLLGGILSWISIKSVLKSLVQDELIRSIELFPDVLQVFIIGLNSGLNTYKAFEFAEKSIKVVAPKLLIQEICRTRFAMECGENHSRIWKRFAEMLPFETVVDFSEIMIVAPMHGESIVDSIIQMAKGYESKKLVLVEKSAVKIGQIVIPLIVIAFFPLFLFSVFAPLFVKIMFLFNS
jgi:Flp pilus assembly protein TadB